MSRRAAVASVSDRAAEAGVRMAAEGGNAVDAAVAASIVAVVTHPGMCSLGGGGFLVVWHGSGRPVAVDGGFEMPGRSLPPGARAGRGLREVHLDYAGGVDTAVGPGSVATPGLVAACGLAAERWGRMPWRELLAPAVEATERGFPMADSPYHYLERAAEIYGADPRSRAALFDEDGAVVGPGGTIRVEALADTLDALAHEGPELFYRGELGACIADHVRASGGLLGREDLESYEARLHEPLIRSLDGWTVATNPPPAVGGRLLAAMLEGMGDEPRDGWSAAGVARLADAQRRAFGTVALRDSPATLHTSAVDEEGNACSATFSDGYGSGVMPPGTGLWLNNCLGEGELNPRGIHAWEPGDRLPSNMAPTVARRAADGAALAVGSPGSDRIPGAVLQALLNRVRIGMTPDEAVNHPRLHVVAEEGGGEGTRAVVEPGLPTGAVPFRVDRIGERAMYMGAVELAEWTPGSGLAAAADRRRVAGTAVGPC